jgi:ATP-dependent DNA ligase
MNRDIQMPEFLCGWAPRTAEEVPDVVIEPKNSIVLELVGAELVPSTDMNSGYYLRFPRVLRRRDDKVCSAHCTRIHFVYDTLH